MFVEFPGPAGPVFLSADCIAQISVGAPLTFKPPRRLMSRSVKGLGAAPRVVLTYSSLVGVPSEMPMLKAALSGNGSRSVLNIAHFSLSVS